MNPRSISVAAIVVLLFMLAHKDGPEPSVTAKVSAAFVAGTLGMLTYVFWKSGRKARSEDDL